LAIVLAAAAVYAIAPGAASAGSSPAASTPADRAAVHAYLLDMYAYAQSITEAAPALVGAYVPVLRLRIPGSLHAGGALVYLASVSQPEEVLVRSPSGKILMDEDRSRTASEGRETCEGESEGSGPPPGGLGGTGETRRIVLTG
jgi:hypothetical protein